MLLKYILLTFEYTTLVATVGVKCGVHCLLHYSFRISYALDGGGRWGDENMMNDLVVGSCGRNFRCPAYSDCVIYIQVSAQEFQNIASMPRRPLERPVTMDGPIQPATPHRSLQTLDTTMQVGYNMLIVYFV